MVVPCFMDWVASDLLQPIQVPRYIHSLKYLIARLVTASQTLVRDQKKQLNCVRGICHKFF